MIYSRWVGQGLLRVLLQPDHTAEKKERMLGLSDDQTYIFVSNAGRRFTG